MCGISGKNKVVQNKSQQYRGGRDGAMVLQKYEEQNKPVFLRPMSVAEGYLLIIKAFFAFDCERIVHPTAKIRTVSVRKYS